MLKFKSLYEPISALAGTSMAEIHLRTIATLATNLYPVFGHIAFCDF